MLSIVLIIPADLRDDANELAELLGYGPNNYSVPLSSDGQEPATHYGLHTWGDQSLLDLLNSDIMPEDIEHYQHVKDAVIASIRETSDDHWQSIITEYKLTTVENA